MTIQVLPEYVVAQIAAGEVVERPASVVKELVENALDAESSMIQVTVNGGGRRLLRVADDGTGIAEQEAEMAFMRHATSKLRTADDLDNIQTLGFRGEALASIASVSHTTLITRHRGANSGLRLRLEAGQVVARAAAGVPAGTIVTVENLFFNTPARLKFLKSEVAEKRQIATIITRYAMAYPHVRFVLEQDGVEVFRTTGGGQLADVMVRALGLEGFKNVLAVDSASGGVHVSGYTSAPELHRSDRSRIALFVNGRWIQDNSLTYAITQAYHTLLMNGRFPISVLMITLPTEDVDVNVHPAKAEVRFRDSSAVFSAVQRAVRRALVDSAPGAAIRAALRSDPVSSNEGPRAQPEQMDLLLHMQGTGQHQRQRRADLLPARPQDDAPTRPRTLPPLRVLGQIGAAYIVAEGPAGMYLIDQHAAHERVLYEQFMDAHVRQGLVMQHALTAQTVTLSPPEAQLLLEHLDSLRQVGFEVEEFGPNTFTIRSVPAILADEDPALVLRQMVSDLESGSIPGQQSVEDRIVLRVCKQAAVKAGQILGIEEMQGIIQQLERCRSPHTCPHGRPTLLHMSSEQLAREFGRLG